MHRAQLGTSVYAHGRICGLRILKQSPNGGGGGGGKGGKARQSPAEDGVAACCPYNTISNGQPSTL